MSLAVLTSVMDSEDALNMYHYFFKNQHPSIFIIKVNKCKQKIFIVICLPPHFTAKA